MTSMISAYAGSSGVAIDAAGNAIRDVCPWRQLWQGLLYELAQRAGHWFLPRCTASWEAATEAAQTASSSARKEFFTEAASAGSKPAE